METSDEAGGLTLTFCQKVQHVVGTMGKWLSLLDVWLNSQPVSKCLSTDEAFEIANDILREMSDREYACRLASVSTPVQLSDRWLLEDFEIVRTFGRSPSVAAQFWEFFRGERVDHGSCAYHGTSAG